MRNKLEKKQPGFEFNWKNKLGYLACYSFIAMSIGYRSKKRKSVTMLILRSYCKRKKQKCLFGEEEYQDEK